MKANGFFKEHGLGVVKDLINRGHNQTHVSNDARMMIDAESYIKACPWFADDVENMVSLMELKRLVESHELIRKIDFWGRLDKGLMKARMVIENNTLQASYFQPSSGAYYRYGHNSIYVVRDNEWKEIYGGMDSNSLIHTDRLKQAIADVESCMEVASESN